MMWDEIFGAGVFIVLFVGGILIYNFVEKRRENKAHERKDRTAR
ncbi:MAG: hypothetical protein NVSMB33_01360 [Ktedonobacteraceae bacterium]